MIFSLRNAIAQKDEEIWAMRTKWEQEKEQIEMMTRTELVDLYSKDIEEQKKESAEILKRELENLTRFYETKVYFIYVNIQRAM